MRGMKRALAGARGFLLLVLTLSLTACGASGEETELTVFAAASLQEALTEVGENYRAVRPGVTLVFSFDSSGTLRTQILEGADCDVFLSAAPKQMDELEERGALAADSRRDLLENQVTLAVPEGNPGGVESFDQLARRLEAGEALLAMGNSDVPVGQYTRKILDYYGLDEAALADSGALTYGSNVKEVAAQVSEGAVDCGIIYATDAASAGLTVVDTAGKELCGQVIYPAAVLEASANPEEAGAFLEYLQTPEAGVIFERVGFTPLQ